MNHATVNAGFSGAFDELSGRRSLHRDIAAWQSPDQWPILLQEAEAVIVRNRTQVFRQMLNAAPQLKVIARAGVGLDEVDVDAADDAGVVVAPLGANATSVAEHAVAMALALSKRLVASDLRTKGGEWNRSTPTKLGGRTWGLLLAGATARATAGLFADSA